MQADGGQLTQALLNLAINAVQAIERGGTIEIRVVHEERFITVEVRDTGPGVPADKLGTVFEPYYTTKPEGTGLGLWIAQQIAIAHGGQIYAQNVPEGGAMFALQLPIKSRLAGAARPSDPKFNG
jgi:two-component system sensor histidine kinase HydH